MAVQNWGKSDQAAKVGPRKSEVQGRKSGTKDGAFRESEHTKNKNSGSSPKLEDYAERVAPVDEWADDLMHSGFRPSILTEMWVEAQKLARSPKGVGVSKKRSAKAGVTRMFTGDTRKIEKPLPQILANALNLELYKIDLSRVISSHHSETEMNLKTLFDRAYEHGAILFFDDASSLFGRSYGSVDNQKNAENPGMKMLLQGMELYRGLSVLAIHLENENHSKPSSLTRFLVNFPATDGELDN